MGTVATILWKPILCTSCGVLPSWKWHWFIHWINKSLSSAYYYSVVSLLGNEKLNNSHSLFSGRLSTSRRYGDGFSTHKTWDKSASDFFFFWVSVNVTKTKSCCVRNTAPWIIHYNLSTLVIPLQVFNNMWGILKQYEHCQLRYESTMLDRIFVRFVLGHLLQAEHSP